MSFMLGSFSGGMFQGASSVANLYGMYQGIQTKKHELDTYDNVEAAMKEKNEKEKAAQANVNKDPGGAITTTEAAPAAAPAPETDFTPLTEHPASSRPQPAIAAPAPAAGTVEHGRSRGDIDRASQVADVGRAAGALDRAVTPPPAAAPMPAVDDYGRPFPTGTVPTPTAAAPVPVAPQVAGPEQPPVDRSLPAGQSATAPNEAMLARTQGAAPGAAPPAAALPATVEAPADPALTVEERQRAWDARRGQRQDARSMRDNAPPGSGETGGQPTPAPGQAPAQAVPTNPDAPSAPASSPSMASAAPSLGSRILSTLNPISTAQAREAPPPAPATAPAAAPAAATPAPATTPAAPAATAASATSAVPAAPAPAKEEIMAGPGAPPVPAAPAPQSKGAVPTGTTSATPQPAPARGSSLPAGVREATVTLPESEYAGRDGSGQQAPTQVAPNQRGPTTQSEASPGMTRAPINPRPYAMLAQQRPEDKALVDRIAEKNGITPDRLAAHWWQESRLKGTSPNGADGERGITQVMPGTQRQVDPRGELDPSKKEDSLEIAARIIHRLDTRFGQNTSQSVIGYQGGEGTAIAFGRGEGNRHPRGLQYLKEMMPGGTIGAKDFPGPIDIDAKSAVQAGSQGGPDGFLKFIANSGPAGVPLSDKWRAAETSLMALAASKGDIDGMRHAQDFVLQMSQQGSTTSLMNAYKAMSAGDGTTAAQQLAKAHAFFPDGAMGRFGVDASGAVWGQRVDEHDPSKTLGDHFKVTPEALQTMMMQTRDPKQFMAMMNEQRKTNAELRYKQQHGDSFAALSGYRDKKLAQDERLRTDTLEANKQSRADRLTEKKYENDLRSEDRELDRKSREDIAANRGTGAGRNPDDALARGVDTEVSKMYGPGGTVTSEAGLTPTQASIAAVVHRELRLNGAGHSQPEAYSITKGLLDKTMDMRAGTGESAGKYAVYSKGNTGGRPEAVISGATAQRLMHLLYPQGAPQGGALGAKPPTVVNPNSSALPSQNAPSTRALN